MSEFIHLHTHSDYSLLDGIASIPNLVAKAKSMGMTHLALTDHGNMFGSLKFYKACLKQGIKPIIGSEFYVTPGGRFQKSSSENMAKYYHLVLLAKDHTGYRNLLELSSKSYLEGFYYKPRIDAELLKEHAQGLICLTSCLAGEIPSLILLDKNKEAKEKAVFYNNLFGKDNFYLELQYHGIPEQKKVNKALVEISQALAIPMVVTNDIHYVEKDDALAHDVAICIGTNKKLSEGTRLKFEHPEFYFKSAEEMATIFSSLPGALQNSLRIAEKCNLEIPFPGPELPHYQVPPGYTLESYLEEIVMKKLTERYQAVTTEMMQRIKYELSVINSMGYTGYFLIVWDFIKFAKEHNIPVGAGRGSGAGSLVAYCLEITDIDPLQYGLLFERFLNPERISMPDFDIDFCFEKRGEVIDYVTQKYGKERVAQIITFGTLKARAVIRDVARVLDIPYAEADNIAKLIPMSPKINLEKAIETEKKLKTLESKGEIYRKLFFVSKKLEGLCRHASTHAAGIVIGQDVLTRYVPLYKDPKTGSIATQYTMDFLEELGLVKMDFLGLKTLTLIQNTMKLLNRRGIEFDINAIPLNDSNTFKMLSLGKSTCVFQFESSGMQNILKRAKPERIEDLIALNALYRPGPMENIDQFINGKLNWTSVQYPLPELEPILKETYGVIVYQEQVMQIAQRVAGFTLGQADILRRAMGKKKREIMTEQKIKFVDGAVKNGYHKETALKLFELLIPFAGYGFNKSHAAAYSFIAYQTAYLKANYPKEFMAANLSNEVHNTDKLADYIKEARGMGMEILPPHLNLSEKEFTVVQGKIVYGLIGAKNIGDAAVDEIIRERREHGEYKSLLDFLARVNLKIVNRKAIEALILSGILDCFGETRATLFHNMDRLMEIAGRKREYRESGQGLLFGDLESEAMDNAFLGKIHEWPKMKLLMDERDSLGFFFSGHPLDDYSDLITKHATLNLAALQDAQEGRYYPVIGLIKSIKEIITKTGKKMAFVEIEDKNGSLETVVFSNIFEKYRDLLQENQVLVFYGKIDLSRGEISFIVDEIRRPENVKQKKTSSVHLRITRDILNEENCYQLRDFLFEQKGDCTIYFHLVGNGDITEKIIKAAPALTIPADEDVLAKLRLYPQIIDAWSE
jgi:DNA polymerase-3 subunit alpha